MRLVVKVGPRRWRAVCQDCDERRYEPTEQQAVDWLRAHYATARHRRERLMQRMVTRLVRVSLTHVARR